MSARTASQVGRASRAKGAQFERAVVHAIRPWFPDVRRSRDNGSATTSDTGDLVDAGPIWWSLKNVAKAQSDPPALIAGWLAEASRKSGEQLPVLVQKRAGHADPLRSWAWLWLSDLVDLLDGTAPHADDAPVRLELRHLLPVLALAGLALAPAHLETS